MKMLTRILQLLVTVLLLASFNTVQADLPHTLNYQGHLTDDNGTPIDASVNMTFRIYNTETDITPLWMDSQTVTVNQGVFSVELGGFSTNPFPPGMFENPLWIGLSVGGDAEMTPRRPITSTGFAFKADDASTLDGVHASTLDQSAHVTDMANPHNVTAAQVGAADAGVLTAHISNTANPHSVTAVQTGAASSGDFTAHASNSAAHHPRYNDNEAVAAMGSKSDANALNHDKYSNTNAVAAILAADGAGSTLDADLVDGLQASELIDAAQDEVRTPISALPYSINASGSYYLTGNLDASSGGININVDNVTINLMGFTIDGGSVADYGIDLTARSNVTIRNGTITNFGYAGIYQNNSIASHATVMDVQALNNGSLGTSSSHAGIYIRSSNSHLERCTAGNNGGYGIFAHTGSKLVNNTAYNNSGTYAIYGGTGSILSGNTAYNNTGSYGIYGSTASSIIGNSAYNNTGVGIYGSNGGMLSGNTAYSNAGIYGIYASAASLIGNSSYSNEHWGIYGGNGALVRNNAIDNNNTSNTADGGGLYVYFNCHVIGNTLNGNNTYNIYVTGSDNSIENNHVTDSTNGIFFYQSGNFYGNNRASGNGTDFNLNGTSQTTSTYLPNISF